jgi:hypothetical protein
MRSATNHSELPVEQDPVYETRTQTGDWSSNLDHFEALLEEAERISKSASSPDRKANGGAAANG